MRVRATLGGIFASAAIIGIGWQFGSAAATTFAAQAATPAAASKSTAVSPSVAAPSTVPTTAPSTAAAPAAAPAAPAAPSGTFVGAVESTPYGDVQIEIVVAGGKITDVKALHLTDQDGRSVQISNRAAPTLRSEVLTSQSAKVNSVSGATYTSDGYLTSVQSALDKAGL